MKRGEKVKKKKICHARGHFRSTNPFKHDSTPRLDERVSILESAARTRFAWKSSPLCRKRTKYAARRNFHRVGKARQRCALFRKEEEGELKSTQRATSRSERGRCTDAHDAHSSIGHRERDPRAITERYLLRLLPSWNFALSSRDIQQLPGRESGRKRAIWPWGGGGG